MNTTPKPIDIEKLLSQADEMLSQVNSGIIEDMKDARRTQIEIHTIELKKRRLEVQDKIEKEKALDHGSAGEGIHEAIDEIVKAMKALTSYLA